MWRKLMKSYNIQTTIYDVFGYLIPGIIILFFADIAYYQVVLGELVYPHIINLNAAMIILIIVGGYILGHALSGLSSLVIEPLMTRRIEFTAIPLSLENILSENMTNCFNEKFNTVFGFDFHPMDFRAVICYVETHKPAVYATAFIFLSFYGMCRTLAFTFSIVFLTELAIWFVFHSKYSLIMALFCLILSISFYYGYFKFYRYFKVQIISGFVIP
jgi:hypothetical protein